VLNCHGKMVRHTPLLCGGSKPANQIQAHLPWVLPTTTTDWRTQPGQIREVMSQKLPPGQDPNLWPCHGATESAPTHLGSDTEPLAKHQHLACHLGCQHTEWWCPWIPIVSHFVVSPCKVGTLSSIKGHGAGHTHKFDA